MTVLRLLASFALIVLILLSGIGLVIARPWGWNEYASSALYVVYYQADGMKHPYFVIDADGSGGSQALIAPDGETLTQIDCSPDGRTFAALTDTGHLYVVTSSGKDYDQRVDPTYSTVSAADDGTIALFDPYNDQLMINDHSVTLATANRTGNEFDRVDISAQGQLLWMRDFNDIQVVSLANGSIVPYVPHGYSGQWFASGQMIAFADNMTDPEGVGLYGGQYLLDMPTQMVIKIGDWDLSRPLSPDGTKTAAPIAVSGFKQRTQIVVYDLFSNDHRIILTHDADHASQPVCFLTFSPQTLIAAP